MQNQLRNAVMCFLQASTIWNLLWTLKPKFHLTLHLPTSIEDHGPASTTATEVFESYNAIIRGWSIHSNRLAPSRDIARAAARWNRVRHIMSGGWLSMVPRSSEDSVVTPEDNPPKSWRTAGEGPRALLEFPE